MTSVTRPLPEIRKEIRIGRGKRPSSSSSPLFLLLALWEQKKVFSLLDPFRQVLLIGEGGEEAERRKRAHRGTIISISNFGDSLVFVQKNREIFCLLTKH